MTNRPGCSASRLGTKRRNGSIAGSPPDALGPATASCTSSTCPNFAAAPGAGTRRDDTTRVAGIAVADGAAACGALESSPAVPRPTLLKRIDSLLAKILRAQFHTVV